MPLSSTFFSAAEMAAAASPQPPLQPPPQPPSTRLRNQRRRQSHQSRRRLFASTMPINRTSLECTFSTAASHIRVSWQYKTFSCLFNDQLRARFFFLVAYFCIIFVHELFIAQNIDFQSRCAQRRQQRVPTRRQPAHRRARPSSASRRATASLISSTEIVCLRKTRSARKTIRFRRRRPILSITRRDVARSAPIARARA